MHIVVVGGGAAAFFFAANAAAYHRNLSITILEQGKDVLQKVRISGGGRCNVTHACDDPEILVHSYPRGQRELLGPFYHFGPPNTVEWFESRGVPLKTEADGRMFPKSNNSQSIIDCLWAACRKGKVEVRTSTKVKNIKPINEGKDGFWVETINTEPIKADKLFMAPGSSKPMWQVLEHLGHTVIEPVPSLFTFQIKDPRIQGLAGVSVQQVEVKVEGQRISTDGPLLITHKGLSGPAVLKLSARQARYFHSVDYKTKLSVDFRPDLSETDIRKWRDTEGKTLVGSHQLLGLPKRLTASLIKAEGFDPKQRLATFSNKQLDQLVKLLKASTFDVLGQNRFKEEFVTAGGVDLKEIDFSNFSSKKYPNLQFAGEVLNIDAVTGGYNFQAAWTGAYIAAVGLKE